MKIFFSSFYVYVFITIFFSASSMESDSSKEREQKSPPQLYSKSKSYGQMVKRRSTGSGKFDGFRPLSPLAYHHNSPQKILKSKINNAIADANPITIVHEGESLAILETNEILECIDRAMDKKKQFVSLLEKYEQIENKNTVITNLKTNYLNLEENKKIENLAQILKNLSLTIEEKEKESKILQESMFTNEKYLHMNKESCQGSLQNMDVILKHLLKKITKKRKIQLISHLITYNKAEHIELLLPSIEFNTFSDKDCKGIIEQALLNVESNKKFVKKQTESNVKYLILKKLQAKNKISEKIEVEDNPDLIKAFVILEQVLKEISKSIKSELLFSFIKGGKYNFILNLIYVDPKIIYLKDEKTGDSTCMAAIANCESKKPTDLAYKILALLYIEKDFSTGLCKTRDDLDHKNNAGESAASMARKIKSLEQIFSFGEELKTMVDRKVDEKIEKTNQYIKDLWKLIENNEVFAFAHLLNDRAEFFVNADDIFITCHPEEKDTILQKAVLNVFKHNDDSGFETALDIIKAIVFNNTIVRTIFILEKGSIEINKALDFSQTNQLTPAYELLKKVQNQRRDILENNH